MTSLFSSFDLKHFYFQIFSFFIFFWFFLNLNFKISSVNSIWEVGYNSMESFFNSMKSSSFSKFFSFSSIMVMVTLLFFNFSGVWSYNFAFTSQISTVLILALSMWVCLLTFFLISNIKGLFSHMIPDGTPIFLTWFLFLIELVSNLIRPLTLMVRLVANILAGHLLMILLFNLVQNLNFMFLFYVILNSVEIFVSLIQSYIFATMLVLYFSELE